MKPLTQEQRKLVEEHIGDMKAMLYTKFKNVTDDMEQESMLLLCKFARRFDPTKEMAMKTYIWRYGPHEMRHYLRNENKHQHISLEDCNIEGYKEKE